MNIIEAVIEDARIIAKKRELQIGSGFDEFIKIAIESRLKIPEFNVLDIHETIILLVNMYEGFSHKRATQ